MNQTPRATPIAIAFGLLGALAGAGLSLGGLAGLAGCSKKSAEQQLSQEQVSELRKNVSAMPMHEALPKWRAWAKNGDVPKLQEEAFEQLAWAKDRDGLPLIVQGLDSTDHRVRGTAATALLEYGSPAADSAKPALLKALKESDTSDKPQIIWALATLHEPSAFDEAMEEYRAGRLATVQRLDGNPAFDPEVMASMVPIDKLAGLSDDPSDSVRQLVATALSRNADPKFTDVLIKLVEDKSVEVAREAAVGLGKIGSERAMRPLLDALAKSDRESRQRFLEALRDGVGGKGLMLALRSIDKSKRETEKFQTKLIFDMLKSLEDPRASDLLVEYIATAQNPHWKTEAGLRLAEVGDLRAVPTLSWRMTQDPLVIYDKDLDFEYRQDDNERVVSARLLADLAILNPSKRAEIREAAYNGIYAWITSKPQPHANGMRFMAATEAKEALPKMRVWAKPSVPFPKEGQQPPFPPEWGTAQSALRYIGWMRDPAAWPILDMQLRRRPANIDATMEALNQGGMAVMGMTLRALGIGAAHGFAQWGDPKAYPLLVKYIEDKQNNEQARTEACFSLGWVATDNQMQEVVQKIRDFDKVDPKAQFIRSCYLESLIRHPVPEATAGLVDLLINQLDLEVRHQAARAIGFGGITREVKDRLMVKLSDSAARNDAALALLLGGDEDTVRRMMGTYNNIDPASIEELKAIYSQTFGYFSDRNYEKGDVARWVRNATAVSRIRVRDKLQIWPRLILSRALQGIDSDNGPHSVTRVQMRVRLMRDAHGDDSLKRSEAIAILKFMGENGVLMALRSEAGPWQEPARQALFELMNPAAVTEALPSKPQAGTVH